MSPSSKTTRYLFLVTRYDTLVLSLKIGLSVIPPTGMALGANIISLQEENGVGLQWTNFQQATSIDDPFTFAR